MYTWMGRATNIPSTSCAALRDMQTSYVFACAQSVKPEPVALIVVIVLVVVDVIVVQDEVDTALVLAPVDTPPRSFSISLIYGFFWLFLGHEIRRRFHGVF